MTRIAVVGMGVWGRQLIRVFDAVSDVVLACNRRDPAARDWLRGAYPRIRSGSSVDEALEDPSIDAVVIATPVDTHADLSRLALRAGKHVFVEKPLATTGSKAWGVVDAAARAGRTLFVGHTFLYDAAYERLHDIVSLDPVERVELSWLKYGTFGEPLAWNLLPHEVGLAIWLTGATPRLRIVERRSGETPTDRLVVDLDFGPGGPTGSIEIDRLHGDKVKTGRVRTRSGREYLWRDGNLDELHPDRPPERLVSHGEETLAREARAFLAAISTGRAARSDGRFGAAVVEVVQEVAEALEAASPLAAESTR